MMPETWHVHHAAEGRVDEDQSGQGFGKRVVFGQQAVDKHGGKPGTSAVASQQQWPRCFATKPFKCFAAILQCRRMPMLRCQPILYSDNLETGFSAPFGTDIIMAFQITENETATMQKQQACSRFGQNWPVAAQSCAIGKGYVPAFHRSRSRRGEMPTQRCIGMALVIEAGLCLFWLKPIAAFTVGGAGAAG